MTGGAGAAAGGGGAAGGDSDLLGMGMGAGAAAPAAVAPAAAGGLDDFFGAPAPRAAPAAAASLLPVCGEKDGLEVRAGLSSKGGVPTLELVIAHKVAGPAPVGACVLKLNANVLGATPASAAFAFPSVAAGASGAASVPLSFAAAFHAPGAAPDAIQAALKDAASGRVVFFNVPIAAGFAGGFSPFVAAPAVDRNDFVAAWRGLAAEHEAAELAKELPTVDAGAVQAKLARAHVAFIATRPAPDPSMSLAYFSAKGVDGAAVFFEVTSKAGMPALKVTCKAAAGAAAARVALAGVVAVLRA